MEDFGGLASDMDRREKGDLRRWRTARFCGTRVVQAHHDETSLRQLNPETSHCATCGARFSSERLGQDNATSSGVGVRPRQPTKESTFWWSKPSCLFEHRCRYLLVGHPRNLQLCASEVETGAYLPGPRC